MIIGITGGTGCGKTTALQILEEHGFLVIDCDRVYHHLLATDPALLDAISRRFPGTVSQNSLDRKKLGKIVFSDNSALSDLNSITHGAVKKAVTETISNTDQPVAIDAIGLFEGGLAPLCDITIAITAPEAAQVSRLIAREGISQEYALARIQAQKSPAEFVALCQYQLENDASEEDFRRKCLAFFQDLGIIEP